MARTQPPRRLAEAPRQNAFFGGAATLALGIMVVKLIGMFYKIPLINIIGEQGSADFNNAYYIYSVLLTISTAGLPVAVSKLVSEANATGRTNQVRKVFRLSLVLFLALGGASFLVMFFCAGALAEMMNDPLAAAGIRALAPAVVCVGCLSAFRGYSQGHSNMTPTAVSQILEALCKLVVGLGLAYWLISAGQSASTAAAGAITGVTVGTIVALAYMMLEYGLHQRRAPARDTADGAKDILRAILRIAIPITLSASMVGIVTVIDSSLVQGRLQSAFLEQGRAVEAIYEGQVDFGDFNEAYDLWQAAGGVVDDKDPLYQDAEAAAVDVSRTLYGNYGGALNLYNLPTSLMAAITASVIPAVSGALARRDRKGAARVTGSALRFTALLALPMGVGLYVLGEPIMHMLYPSLNQAVAGPLLSTLGLATPFVCLMLVCNSILQAHGFVNLPVVIMVLGGGVKIFTNYNLVVLPQVGIYGAPVGNVLCFGLCLALDLVLIARVIPNRPRYAPLFLKSIAASAVMGAAAWAVYGLGAKVLSHDVLNEAGEVIGRELSRGGSVLSVLLSIAVAMAVYGILVVALRAITREDLMLMPKGEKIAKLLHLS